MGHLWKHDTMNNNCLSHEAENKRQLCNCRKTNIVSMNMKPHYYVLSAMWLIKETCDHCHWSWKILRLKTKHQRERASGCADPIMWHKSFSTSIDYTQREISHQPFCCCSLATTCFSQSTAPFETRRSNQQMTQVLIWTAAKQESSVGPEHVPRPLIDFSHLSLSNKSLKICFKKLQR